MDAKIATKDVRIEVYGAKTLQGRKSLGRVLVPITVLKLRFYKCFLSCLKRNRESAYSGIKIDYVI